MLYNLIYYNAMLQRILENIQVNLLCNTNSTVIIRKATYAILVENESYMCRR